MKNKGRLDGNGGRGSSGGRCGHVDVKTAIPSRGSVDLLNDDRGVNDSHDC